MRRLAAGIALVAVIVPACGPPAPPPGGDRPLPEAAGPVRPQPPDPWEDARSRGIEFRALGQEPGWFLEIDHERWIRFFYDYAERHVTMPVPDPAVQGTSVVYDVTSVPHRLRVVIDEGRCEDVMSGEAFPRRVTVVLDGRSFEGCGRPLEPTPP